MLYRCQYIFTNILKSAQDLIFHEHFQIFHSNTLTHIFASYSFNALIKRVLVRSFYVLFILLP